MSGEMDEHQGKSGQGLEAVRVRLRIVFGQAMRLGPGKIDLLDAIARTGSISAAGRDLGMSYRRSWLLIDAVNRMFHVPAVQASAGGAQGGGAHLTEFGEALVAAYRRVEARTKAAIVEEFAPFADQIADDVTDPAPEGSD